MATRGKLPPSDEARAHHMANLPPDASHGAWAGWVTFAASVLMLLGAVHIFEGFVALFDTGYFAVSGDELFLMSYDAWGILLMSWGAALIIIGGGLQAHRGWARWLAIAGVMLNVVVQVAFFRTMPLLSLTLIALDVTVLYALTARWAEA
jgi:hypothetical protein